MESSELSFCPLADLMDRANARCVCLILKRRCNRWVSQGDSNIPLALLGSNLNTLTAPGGYTEASAQFELFKKFADRYLCIMHKDCLLQAARQWLDEFDANRASFTLKLENYRKTRKSNDTQTKAERIEDGNYEFDSGEWKADTDTDEFEEEAFPKLSTQPTSSIGALRRTITMEETEVAQRVTWRLEQCLEGRDKTPGWIYVMRPHNLHGLLKIGCTRRPMERLKQLNSCYGKSELIMMKYSRYARRVEYVLMIEFSNNRYNLDCQKCMSNHRELFAIDKEILLRSLTKWINFVESPSYSKSGELLPEAVLPPPASKDYLGCKPTPRRVFADTTAGQKAESQDSYNVILPRITHEESNQAMAVTPSAYSLKDPERDSGYASASRPATLAVSSESAFRDGIESLAASKLDETRHLYVNEIQSFASDNDDIGSLASDETTNEGMTGKALIGVFLSEEPNFRSLCDKATAHMDRQRFVENLRRLLKAFHKNLAAEAESEAEKAVARLLRSRRGRLRISQQLAVYFPQEQEVIGEGDRVDTRVAPEDKHRVETWLRTLQRAIDPQEFEDQNIVHESGVSDSDDDSMRDEFPYISELEIFLRRARSFQTLLKDFMLMFLPTDVRHVLLSIPRKQIWVSQEQDVSLANRVKAWVEDSTKVRWNWWPFEPRKRMLQEGESRMFWQCTCGARQWEEISAEQDKLVKKILALSDDKPQLSHWCRTKASRVLLTTSTEDILHKAPSASTAATVSVAAQKYTPPENVKCTSSSAHGILPSDGGQSSVTAPTQPHQGSPITGQQVQIAAPNPTGQTQSWILFGVQGARRTLTPAQISVNDQSTDYSVFQELKESYRTHRGRLRLWFSIWRLEFCEVVKVH
ncbi:hypothetical protein IFM61606_09579 [Aspergillus udagawae]|nr:hypothetical protein IFM61606_09579 [Aspergillus udagawae]